MAIAPPHGFLVSRCSRTAAAGFGAVFRSAALQANCTSNQALLDRTGRVLLACMAELARKGLHVLPAIVLLPYVACAFRRLQRGEASHMPMLGQGL